MFAETRCSLATLAFWLPAVVTIACSEKPREEPQQALDAMVVVPEDSFDCDVLDYGLFWYGPGDQSVKFIRGEANPFYDANQPTVIYVHGWEKGTTERVFRETFNYLHNDSGNGFDIDTADAWIDKGWNVGIFYWNQFSDEGEVKEAEEKIWSAKGRTEMRWRMCDGSYSMEGEPTDDAGKLFYQAYRDALSEFQGDNIRVVGHSLGSQMALRLASLVQEGIAMGVDSPKLLPRRIALLDAFWSRGNKDYLGGVTNAEHSSQLVESLLLDGVIFERYKTSNINLLVGDHNNALVDRIGETELIAGWVSPLDQAGRHISAPFLYFQSYAAPPPPGCRGADCSEPGPSAATSDAITKDLMEEASRWIQREGRDTSNSDDDVLELIED